MTPRISRHGLRTSSSYDQLIARHYSLISQVLEYPEKLMGVVVPRRGHAAHELRVQPPFSLTERHSILYPVVDFGA